MTLKTEDEARMTRCCVTGCGGNSAGEPEMYCMASDCMGWRRFNSIILVLLGIKRRRGYCGRAGQP